METPLTWLLLLLAVVLILFGAMRFDLLAARWRNALRPPSPHDAPKAAPPTPDPGLRPHAAPQRKPPYHRSGRRH